MPFGGAPELDVCLVMRSSEGSSAEAVAARPQWTDMVAAAAVFDEAVVLGVRLMWAVTTGLDPALFLAAAAVV